MLLHTVFTCTPHSRPQHAGVNFSLTVFTISHPEEAPECFGPKRSAESNRTVEERERQHERLSKRPTFLAAFCSTLSTRNLTKYNIYSINICTDQAERTIPGRFTKFSLRTHMTNGNQQSVNDHEWSQHS